MCVYIHIHIYTHVIDHSVIGYIVLLSYIILYDIITRVQQRIVSYRVAPCYISYRYKPQAVVCTLYDTIRYRMAFHMHGVRSQWRVVCPLPAMQARQPIADNGNNITMAYNK